MEGYDVEGGGDLDNQSFMSMDKFNKLESGRLHISAFNPKKSRQRSEPSTGYFEKHTKGVGRKLLEKQGKESSPFKSNVYSSFLHILIL